MAARLSATARASASAANFAAFSASISSAAAAASRLRAGGQRTSHGVVRGVPTAGGVVRGECQQQVGWHPKGQHPKVKQACRRPLYLKPESRIGAEFNRCQVPRGADRLDESSCNSLRSFGRQDKNQTDKRTRRTTAVTISVLELISTSYPCCQDDPSSCSPRATPPPTSCKTLIPACDVMGMAPTCCDNLMPLSPPIATIHHLHSISIIPLIFLLG